MPQSIMEMTKDIVMAQIQARHVGADGVHDSLKSTHQTLWRLNLNETSATVKPPLSLTDWKKSISKHTVICLECNESFRQLSLRHLRQHDMTPQDYRRKHGIPRTQSLSSREVTTRRRQLAREIRPWEQATAARNIRASQTTTTATAKRSRKA